MYDAWHADDLPTRARVPRSGVRVGQPRLRGRAGHAARPRRVRQGDAQTWTAPSSTRRTCWGRSRIWGTECCGTPSSRHAARQRSPDRGRGAAPVDATRRQDPPDAVVPRRRRGAPRRRSAAGRPVDSARQRLRAGYAAFNDSGDVSGDPGRAGSRRGAGASRWAAPRARSHFAGTTASPSGPGRWVMCGATSASSRSRWRVDPAGRRALRRGRVSTRGRASDLGLEAMEAPRGHDWARLGRSRGCRGSPTSDLARAAFRVPDPGL